MADITLPEVTVTATRLSDGPTSPVDRHDDPPPPTKPATAPAPGSFGALSYVKRKINITVQVGTGPYGEGPKETVTLRGYRCSVTVTVAGRDAPPQCQARVWGMNFSLMQRLNTYGDVYAASRHFVMMVEAGDDDAGMTQIFIGTVTEAYFDGESQPDVAFQMVANEGTKEALKPVPPISVQGAVDVAGVMASLASQMGASFENHGVTAKLRDIYYPGTAYHQMRRIAQHAGIHARLENGVLAIWPNGEARGGSGVPLITPLSGLKNYPTFSSQWISAQCLFQPLKHGQEVQIESSLWNHDRWRFYVISYTYTLESEMPNGPWFTMFHASKKVVTV
jgi:hypothetical protein